MCFDGSCTVLMADRTIKRVDNIKKGDIVMGPNNSRATVVCSIKTVCLNNKVFVVKFSGNLLITPFHPIRLDGKWIFPKDVGQVYEIDSTGVYSFILDCGHTMKICGIECITLGHGFQDEGAKHDYFGTNKVVDDLKTMDGYSDGFVILSYKNVKRDPITNLFTTITFRE
jgi:hypothetical protein